MRVITREQAQNLDRMAMGDYGISGEALMGNAGLKLAEFIRLNLVDIHSPKIGIVCGKGNNGGDGFAAGELLHLWGFNVKIYAMVEKNAIDGDALIY
ncbi:MAG: bifunctional ADP-dependent NAD(P)H-hydrate dehydratase/NAD(P)H-hydrate epimerase, partial [Candidatus Marinimicrobia bacterium]|nr:bifunctional ADP-dependent NAD(P)H-hydrate dehydratase/NAD(P)H-hydrate epimerase [Candidatus Neomarinimicrobiota bacterium]